MQNILIYGINNNSTIFATFKIKVMNIQQDKSD